MARLRLAPGSLTRLPSYLFARHLLPSERDDVTELRLEFAEVGGAPELFARDQRRAGAGERIEYEVRFLRGIAEHLVDESDRLHRRMVLVLFRLRDFHHGRLQFLDGELLAADLKPLVPEPETVEIRLDLRERRLEHELGDGRGLPVAVPLVRSRRLPSVEDWLVLPLVVRTTEHERILTPDETAGELEPCVLERAAKIQTFGVSVANIDGGAVLQHTEHDGVRAEQERAELAVLHIVVLDLPRAAFIVHVVRGIGEHGVRLRAGEKFLDNERVRRVATDEPVLPELDELAWEGRWLRRRCGNCVLLGAWEQTALVDVQKRVDLVGVEPGRLEIESELRKIAEFER